MTSGEPLERLTDLGVGGICGHAEHLVQRHGQSLRPRSGGPTDEEPWFATGDRQNGPVATEITIVVVEDDPNIADLLDMYLRKEGWRVLSCSDGGPADSTWSARPHRGW